MATTGVLKNVQILRAAAAYLVVLYHARLLTPVGEAVSFDFGNAGVDIFFLISGFIIAHVSRSDDVGRPGAFLLKRVIRVVPLYWVLTLMLFVVAQRAPALAGAGGRPDLAMLAKSLFFVPYLDGSGAMHPVLFMGWTLDYEMFFYLVFGAALLIRAELPRLLAVSATLGSLAMIGLVTHPQGVVAQTYTDMLMLEFVVGLWLNRAYRSLPAHLPRHVPPLLLAAALGAVVILAAGDVLWPQLPREVKWGLPAIVLVASTLALERGGATIGWRWLMLVGEASYTIYLTHPFLIKLVSVAYQRLHIVAMPLHVAALIGLYLLVGLVGIATHLIVEKPLTRWLRHRFLPRARPSIATGDPLPLAT